jgi:hypothetical protein
MCATTDGTRKSLLNIVIAGLKVGKNKEQNDIFQKVHGVNPNEIGIHSERFYIPLVGALCKETKDNGVKYFATHFKELRDISDKEIYCCGKSWKFKFILCTDLKAQWSLMKVGGGNAKTQHCCPGERTTKFTKMGVCNSCKRRNRKDPCVHTNMYANVSCDTLEQTLKITWKIPPNRLTTNKDNGNSSSDYIALVAEESKAEIEKLSNVELIETELLKRFETKEAIGRACHEFSCEGNHHKLFQHCHSQERARRWLLELDEAGSVAMWVDRMATVPDTLHMELRVGEEFITQVVQVCLMDRNDIFPGESKAKKLAEKERRLDKVSVAMGFLMSNNDFSNFTITCEKNHREKVNKIAMNNDRLRNVFNGIESLINIIYDGDDERTLHASTIATLITVTKQWIEIRDAFRTDEDITTQCADELQDKIDEWAVGYFSLFKDSGGSYLHMLHKGHMRDYLLIHKNLHKWCNIDSEAHNGFLKHMLAHRCQGGGHKNSAHGGNQEREYIANTLMRFYIRRIMWLLDPSAVERLKAAKIKHPFAYKFRDVLTLSTSTFVPKTYLYDEYNLIGSIYDVQ